MAIYLSCSQGLAAIISATVASETSEDWKRHTGNFANLEQELLFLRHDSRNGDEKETDDG